jgi:glycosyltransferase involved in cell wall biosynthesis
MMITKKLLIIGGEDVYMRIPLIRELEKKGLEVYVAGSGGEDIFKSNNINFHRYKLNRAMSLFDDIETVKELRKIIKHVDPNVVQSFDTKPSILVPLASLGHPHKVVRTITGMGYAFSSDSFFAKFLRFLYKIFQIVLDLKVDLTVFQNEDDFKYYTDNNLLKNHKGLLIRGSGLDLKKIETCIDTLKYKEEILDGVDYDCVFLMVTRLVRHKGVMDYLQAAEGVLSEHKKCKFILVGPLEGNGEDAISEDELAQFSESVLWLGPRNDVLSIMEMSDVFVLPTYYREGVPRVLLEAASKSLPVITSDMPGCRDIIRDHKEGLLVSVKDPYSLKKAMIKLLEDEGMRNRMGHLARYRVVNYFSLDIIAGNYVNAYNSVLVNEIE